MARTLRDAARRLRRAPGFTLTAVAILTLGIGANSAIFSVLYTVLLQPLPYAEPERLVVVWENDRLRGTQREGVSLPDYLDWRQQATVFEDIAAHQTINMTLASGSEAERLRAGRVTASYFRVLGVPPLAGRLFREDEQVEGRHRVVLLSEGLWRSRFGGSHAIIGGVLRLNGDNYTVAGVMPASTAVASGAAEMLWVPISFERNDMFRGRHIATAYARLKPGVALEQAQSEMTAIMKRLEAAYPDDNEGRGAWVRPLHGELVTQVSAALWVLGGGVVCLLLMACVNLTNLFLARAGIVTREMAVRLALGASRRQLAAQLLTEVTLLAIAGAAAGAVLATWSVRALAAMAPVTLPFLDPSGVSWRMLAVLGALALVTVLAVALAPILRLAGKSTEETLRQGGRAASAGAREQRLRYVLVAGEVALSTTLLIGAGLLVRSMSRLLTVDPGLDPRNVLTASIELPPSRYPFPRVWPVLEWPQVARFRDQLLESMRGIPGVTSAAVALNRPLDSGWTTRVTVEGRPAPPPGQQEEARFRPVGENYFETLRIRLISGRTFRQEDDARRPLVAVINRAFVERHFREENPMGRRIAVYGAPREIVGVVADVRFRGLALDAQPAMYLPERQNPMGSISIVLRSASEPAALLPEVRRRVAKLDPELALFDAATLEEMMSLSVGARTFTTILLGGFAGVALALALIGVYGVVSTTVSLRTREIGVRTAFGARPADVLRLILGRAVALAAVGLAMGLALAAWLGKHLAGLLFRTDRFDVVTFAAVAAILLLAAVGAAWVPARRAARIEPVSALRYE